jgi:hypothetical protein
MRFRRIYLAPVLSLMLAASIAACSSSSSSSSASSGQAPSAPASSSPAVSASPVSSGTASPSVAAITANWEKFFGSSTPQSARLALLENGSKFASAVSAFAGSPLASAVSAKVVSVKLVSATEATVTYDLAAGGQTVEKDATGQAVYQDGTWKVGDSSFCGLLREGAPVMNIKVPAVCS